jgi:hypothetical protein
MCMCRAAQCARTIIILLTLASSPGSPGKSAAPSLLSPPTLPAILPPPLRELEALSLSLSLSPSLPLSPSCSLPLPQPPALFAVTNVGYSLSLVVCSCARWDDALCVSVCVCGVCVCVEAGFPLPRPESNWRPVSSSASQLFPPPPAYMRPRVLKPLMEALRELPMPTQAWVVAQLISVFLLPRPPPHPPPLSTAAPDCWRTASPSISQTRSTLSSSSSSSSSTTSRSSSLFACAPSLSPPLPPFHSPVTRPPHPPPSAFSSSAAVQGRAA